MPTPVATVRRTGWLAVSRPVIWIVPARGPAAPGTAATMASMVSPQVASTP
jgi:hypothetical protein